MVVVPRDMASKEAMQARLQELKARREQVRAVNREEVAEEDRLAKLPSNHESRKRRAEWELSEQQVRPRASGLAGWLALWLPFLFHDTPDCFLACHHPVTGYFLLAPSSVWRGRIFLHASHATLAGLFYCAPHLLSACHGVLTDVCCHRSMLHGALMSCHAHGVSWDNTQAREKAEAEGKDYDRIKARNVTASELEARDRKRKKKNPDTGFAGKATLVPAEGPHSRRREEQTGAQIHNNLEQQKKTRQAKRIVTLLDEAHGR